MFLVSAKPTRTMGTITIILATGLILVAVLTPDNATACDKNQALITAVGEGHNTEVMILLSEGTDVNAKATGWRTALRFSVRHRILQGLSALWRKYGRVFMDFPGAQAASWT
jgi:hypothetical protein